jgi:hypothetical protein
MFCKFRILPNIAVYPLVCNITSTSEQGNLCHLHNSLAMYPKVKHVVSNENIRKIQDAKELTGMIITLLFSSESPLCVCVYVSRICDITGNRLESRTLRYNTVTGSLKRSDQGLPPRNVATGHTYSTRRG